MISKGHILRLLRESLDLRQEDVAKELKITASYLSLIEHNKKQPSHDVLLKLANRYKVPFQLLMWDENDLKRTTNPKERELVGKMDKFMQQLYFLVMKRDGKRLKA